MRTKSMIAILLIALCILSFSAIAEDIDFNDYLVHYEYSANDAISGEKFTLKITITNLAGETREDVSISIDDNDPFEIIGEDDYEINELLAGDSASRSFRIKINSDTQTNDYELYFEINDNKEDYDDSFIIEVSSIVPEIIIGNVQSLPTLLTADLEDVELKIDLQNIGDGEANYLRAKLILPNGFEASNSYSDTSNIGTLTKSQSKTVTFFININKNVVSNLHQGKVNIDYEDAEGNKNQETLNFDLPVKGIPLFDVLKAITSPIEIYPGSTEVQLNINIKNIGAEEGKETSVRIFENSDLPFEFQEKTNYIGNLIPNNNGKAVFLFDVNEDAAINNYYVKIQVRTVNKNNVLVSEHTIPINVIKEPESSWTILHSLFIFFVILLLFLIATMTYYLTKKK